MSTPTAANAPRKGETLREFMSELLNKKNDGYNSRSMIESLTDKLAFILQNYVGFDAVLDHSKISLIFGDSELHLMYNGKLVLKGSDEDNGESYGLLGLFEVSRIEVEKYIGSVE